MNRMLSKITAGAALVLLILALTASGCHDRDQHGGTVNPTGGGVKITALLPLTGPGAPFAEYIRKGLDLASADIDPREPGALALTYQDSKSEPREAVSVFQQEMLTDKPPVTIVALSSVTKALAPLAKSGQTVMIATAVGLPDVTAPSDYVFRVYPEANGIAGVIAPYASSKYKTAAVVYIDDDFGASCARVFQSTFESRGGKVLITEPFKPRETDFRPEWEKVKAAAPDCVWVVGYGPAYSVVINQMRETQVKSVLLADMTLGLPMTLKNVGAAAEGVVYVDGPMNPDFVQKYQQKYGEQPTSYAGYAYDILGMVNQARKGGTSPAQIRDAFAAIHDYRGAMGDISILPNRDASLKFILMQIKNGKPTVYKG